MIAIIALYLIYRYFKKNDIAFDSHFLKSLLPFVLFGSIKRAITDATDAGIAKGFIYEQFYGYNIFNVTPGIYVVTAFLFLSSFIIEHKYRIRNLSFYFGLFLALSHLFLLSPFLFHIERLILILFLSSTAYGIAFLFFKNEIYRIAIFSQGFDGAATFFGIEFFGYKEQHVIPSIIGEQFGFLWFFIIKVAITSIFLFLLDKEKIDEQEKNLIVYAIIVMGLAPGLRDTLRLMGNF